MRGKNIVRIIVYLIIFIYRNHAGDYKRAIELYSNALIHQTLDAPKEVKHELLLNRNLCFFKTGQYHLCIAVGINKLKKK